mmetsp:Transcript_71671/g.173625  ORF Transcript_71671/g.173625 Transcript_71671/m.173625 type:complete len:424 (-) Transcript_71671:174-1445(-)
MQCPILRLVVVITRVDLGLAVVPGGRRLRLLHRPVALADTRAALWHGGCSNRRHISRANFLVLHLRDAGSALAHILVDCVQELERKRTTHRVGHFALREVERGSNGSLVGKVEAHKVLTAPFGARACKARDRRAEALHHADAAVIPVRSQQLRDSQAVKLARKSHSHLTPRTLAQRNRHIRCLDALRRGHDDFAQARDTERHIDTTGASKMERVERHLSRRLADRLGSQGAHRLARRNHGAQVLDPHHHQEGQLGQLTGLLAIGSKSPARVPVSKRCERLLHPLAHGAHMVAEIQAVQHRVADNRAHDRCRDLLHTSATPEVHVKQHLPVLLFDLVYDGRQPVAVHGGILGVVQAKVPRQRPSRQHLHRSAGLVVHGAQRLFSVVPVLHVVVAAARAFHGHACDLDVTMHLGRCDVVHLCARH